MMKKRLLLLIFALMVMLAAVSCAPDAPRKAPESPERVAVLMSSLAEIWLEAGGEVAITVGETIERGFAPEGTPLVDSGAGKTVNLELLIALAPDLVICSADIPAQVEAESLLREAGISTLLLRVETLADYLEALGQMTDITGHDEAYQNALAMKARIDRLILANKTALEGRRVLFLRAGSSAASTKAKGSEDHFAAAMLRELGCINIADGAPLALDNLGMEAVIAADPDYVFFSLMGDEAAARDNVESLISTPVWQSLTAIRDGDYTILDRSLFHFKPCSRWEKAYLTLVEILRA